MIQSNSVNVKE